MNTYNRCYDIFLSDSKAKRKIYNAICFLKYDRNELINNRHKILHENEVTAYYDLTHYERQATYLAGKHSAKLALIKLNHALQPTDIHIDNGLFGFPYIKCTSIANTQISISHSGNVAMSIAYYESHPMAVDVELIDSERVEIISANLSIGEAALLKTSNVDRNTALTTIWTSKEALAKVLKCGLMVDFSLLEIDKIRKIDNYCITHYKNFTHYCCKSFVINDAVYSIVYPANTSIELDDQFNLEFNYR